MRITINDGKYDGQFVHDSLLVIHYTLRLRHIRIAYCTASARVSILFWYVRKVEPSTSLTSGRKAFYYIVLSASVIPDVLARRLIEEVLTVAKGERDDAATINNPFYLF